MSDDTQPAPVRPRLPVETTVLLGLLLFGIALVVVRTFSPLQWPWALVLAPFTVAGAVFLVTMVAMMVRPRLAARGFLRFGRPGDDAVSNPPDHLEPPVGAEEGGDRILVEHPELLAALCLGFRMKRLAPEVLGRPVTDAWGVYKAAVSAPPLAFEMLRIIARKHTELYAAEGAKRLGRTPGMAAVLKRAEDHFRRCAEKWGQGRAHPDCPFEHVVVMFGAWTPSRDAHLRSVAPKVRAILERQYPQIATASLGDGSRITYSDWQKQATHDRQELARLRKDAERTNRALRETAAQLSESRAQTDALRADADAARANARAAARAEQEATVASIRAEMEHARIEHTRQIQRLDGDQQRLTAVVQALTAERDTLEAALFADSQQPQTASPVPADNLAGVRVLLVGGEARQLTGIRDALDACGVQLLHEDSEKAAELVAGVHLVVFWIRYLSHPKYFAVRKECRVRGVRPCYWTRTSPDSLIELIASALTPASGKA